jgi:hypothetical protein
MERARTKIFKYTKWLIPKRLCPTFAARYDNCTRCNTAGDVTDRFFPIQH